MITYQDKSVNLRTAYTVEYLDNVKDAEYVDSGRIDQGEPWERYKSKQFNSFDKAASLFMVMFVRSDIYDVKFFEETYLNDQVVREQYIEPALTTSWSVKQAVNKTMEKRIESLQEANDMLAKEIELYQEFITKYNAKKTFEQFRRERIA